MTVGRRRSKVRGLDRPARQTAFINLANNTDIMADHDELRAVYDYQKRKSTAVSDHGEGVASFVLTQVRRGRLFFVDTPSMGQANFVLTGSNFGKTCDVQQSLLKGSFPCLYTSSATNGPGPCVIKEKRPELKARLMLPPFDFRDLPLSRDARNQLGGVYGSLLATGKVPQSKGRMHGALLAHAFRPETGTYMVLSSDVELFRKLPTYSKAARPTQGPFPTCYFSNALVIPSGFGEPGFDAARATKPSMRAANIGMIIVTHEFDCETSDQLEENLEWTRKGGSTMAPILRVAAELKRFRDFRGVTAVFSGSRSIHFHFAFSTDHFQHAPVHPNAAARGTSEQHADSALLHKAHNVLWDRVGDIMQRVLSPSMTPDKQMRSLTKYRRAPFGIRLLDKD